MYVYPEKVTEFRISEIVVEQHGRYTPVGVYQTYRNLPINLRNTKTFYPSSEAATREHKDACTLFTIIFDFIDGTKQTWHFEKEEDRDEEHARLISKLTEEQDGNI